LPAQLHRASRLRWFHCRRINSPETPRRTRKGRVESIAKLENDSNHASEEIGMFNRLTAINEGVSLIREKLVEGKPVPELDLRLKRLSADRNKTLTQIGESIAVLHAES
jgi:hypothetical protein